VSVPQPAAPAAGASRGWLAARAAAVFLLIVGLLPIVNWIPGGRQAPWYATAVGGWLSGSAIVLGAAVVLVMVSRRVPALRPDAWLDHPAVARIAASRLSGLALAALALLLYVLIARLVFGARPLVIDEVLQTFQAQILVRGRLWLPTGPHPEFVSQLNLIDVGGKTYSHFPIGGPAMLALGELIHAPWLVNPIAGAVSVLLFHRLVSRIEPRPRARLAATILFAFAPFTAFMAGSFMNHVPALTWLLLGLVGLAEVTVGDRPSAWWAFACGLGFGMAATIRPIDAAIFAAPAGVWICARVIRGRLPLSILIAAGAGLAVPLAALLASNWATTGAPLRFGYQVMWGPDVGLGFHPSPWGERHTPSDGLEFINLYFVRLQDYLYESPVPGLVPVIGALFLTRRLPSFDRYLLLTAGMLVAAYFAYWHDGYYLGPRFMYPLLPLLVLWTARLPSLVRERFSPAVTRGVLFGYGTSAIIACIAGVPVRLSQYAGMFPVMRWNVSETAQAAGVRDAIVLVRETWGAQLLARMWALGLPRPEAERIFRHVDACRLEEAISELEVHGDGRSSTPAAALSAIAPLMADSSRLVRSPFSPDSSERFEPGRPYPALCVERINDDRGGTTLLAPLLLARDGNLYVRDLHQRNRAILEEYPGRPVFLLRPPAGQGGALPVFHPVSRDSLLALGSSSGPPAR
jgi:hypothetical protein